MKPRPPRHPRLLLSRLSRGASRLPRFLLSPEAVFLTVILLVIAAVALGFIGVYAVPTGSMEPSIPRGSLVVVAKVSPAEVKVGDVALVIDRQAGILVAHRVVGKDLEMGVLMVKGDAVEAVSEVPFSDFLGVVVFHLPYAGYPFIHRQLIVAAALLTAVIALYLTLR